MPGTIPPRHAAPAHTIGQLARRAGVAVSTVRYYERSGLLRPDGRTGGNYRSYTDRSLERLRFIRAAQATGFSLRDVRKLLGLTSSPGLPCREVEAVTRKRLEEVRGRIRELRQVEGVLERALKGCCRNEEVDLCRDLGRLQSAARTSPTCRCD